jgi:hypothetical protein
MYSIRHSGFRYHKRLAARPKRLACPLERRRTNMSDPQRPYALDIADRDNLDDEMRTLVKGIEKKYGFTPNFLKFFKTDNKRLRAFITPYMELLRPDSGLSHVEGIDRRGIDRRRRSGSSA